MGSTLKLLPILAAPMLLVACGGSGLGNDVDGGPTGYADGIADGVSGRMSALESIGAPIPIFARLDGSVNAKPDGKGIATIDLMCPRKLEDVVGTYETALIVRGYQNIKTRVLGDATEVSGKSAKAEIRVRITPINNGEATDVLITLKRQNS